MFLLWHLYLIQIFSKNANLHLIFFFKTSTGNTSFIKVNKLTQPFMRVPKTLSQTITDYSHPSAKNNTIFFLSTIFNEVSIKILPFKNGLDKKETWIFSIQFLPQCRVPLWIIGYPFSNFCPWHLLYLLLAEIQRNIKISKRSNKNWWSFGRNVSRFIVIRIDSNGPDITSKAVIFYIPV